MWAHLLVDINKPRRLARLTPRDALRHISFLPSVKKELAGKETVVEGGRVQTFCHQHVDDFHSRCSRLLRLGLRLRQIDANQSELTTIQHQTIRRNFPLLTSRAFFQDINNILQMRAACLGLWNGWSSSVRLAARQRHGGNLMMGVADDNIIVSWVRSAGFVNEKEQSCPYKQIW